MLQGSLEDCYFSSFSKSLQGILLLCFLMLEKNCEWYSMHSCNVQCDMQYFHAMLCYTGGNFLMRWKLCAFQQECVQFGWMKNKNLKILFKFFKMYFKGIFGFCHGPWEKKTGPVAGQGMAPKWEVVVCTNSVISPKNTVFCAWLLWFASHLSASGTVLKNNPVLLQIVLGYKMAVWSGCLLCEPPRKCFHFVVPWHQSALWFPPLEPPVGFPDGNLLMKPFILFGTQPLQCLKNFWEAVIPWQGASFYERFFFQRKPQVPWLMQGRSDDSGLGEILTKHLW